MESYSLINPIDKQILLTIGLKKERLAASTPQERLRCRWYMRTSSKSSYIVLDLYHDSIIPQPKKRQTFFELLTHDTYFLGVCLPFIVVDPSK